MRCQGSFKTVSTDVAGRVVTVDTHQAFSKRKVKIPCPWCYRVVGLRAELKGCRGVLALHEAPEK